MEKHSDSDDSDFEIPTTKVKVLSQYSKLPWFNQMDALLQYHTCGTYPFHNMSKERKRDFRRAAKRYVVVNGNLHLKKPVQKDGEKQGKSFKTSPFRAVS